MNQVSQMVKVLRFLQVINQYMKGGSKMEPVIVMEELFHHKVKFIKACLFMIQCMVKASLNIWMAEFMKGHG